MKSWCACTPCTGVAEGKRYGALCEDCEAAGCTPGGNACQEQRHLAEPIRQARFKGQCMTCGGPVRKGDEVRYRRGQGPRHADCRPKKKS